MGSLIPVTGLRAQNLEMHSLGITASASDITHDKNGNLHILWVSNGVVYYGRVVNYRVINQERVATITTTECQFARPRIAVRNDGRTVHTVWGNLTLVHAWRDTNGVWRTETVRNAVTDRRYYGAVCAVTPDETVHVLYQLWNAKAPATPMNYVRKANGGTWTSPVALVPNSNAEYRDPSVFVDSYGGLHASWRGLMITPSAPYLYAPAGTNLEDATAVFLPKSSDVTHNAKGDLFVNEETGRVHRPIGGWTKRLSIVIDYSHKNLGGSFTTPTRPSIDDLETELDSNPTVAADNAGHVFVSYRDFVDGKTVVYLSILSDGSWTKYVVDPNAGTTYNQNIKSALTATEAGVFGIWRSITGEVILAAAEIPPPSSGITVGSPNNNERLAPGSNHAITWTSEGVSGNVDIYLYRHFNQVGVIASDVPVADGSYDWKVGSYQGGMAPVGPGYKIRIRTSDGRYGDYSNGAYTMSGTAASSLTVISPNGGESLNVGSSHAITWSAANLVGNVNIYLDRNGSLLGTIATGVAAATGTRTWTVGSHSGGTAPAGSGYAIRVETTDGETVDSSDDAFSLAAQTAPLELITPNGGESWNLGTTQRISWSSSRVTGNLNLYLYRGTSNLGLIASGVPVAGGGYDWRAGYLKSGTKVSAGTAYRVSIVSAANKAINDISAAYFSIVKPTISVKTPSNGSSWKIGTSQGITWTFASVTGDVDIFLYKDDVLKGQIADDIPVSNLSYSWTVGNLIGGSAVKGTGYSVCIKSADGSVKGWSAGTFKLTL
jgi:hypothetical protein